MGGALRTVAVVIRQLKVKEKISTGNTRTAGESLATVAAGTYMYVYYAYLLTLQLNTCMEGYTFLSIPSVPEGMGGHGFMHRLH